MLADPSEVIARCDVLYIASPPSSHIPHAEAALAAGKAVFMEKPLASSLTDARRFVAEAERRGARAAVNFPMASSPAVAQLSTWRASLGEPEALAIRLAFARWPRSWQERAASWLSKRMDGGFTREVLSHFLFLTRRQLGPLRLLSGSATFPSDDGAETAIQALVMAGSTQVAISGDVGSTAADDHNEWRLQCQGGAIRLRDWSFAEKHAVDVGWHPAPDGLPNENMRPMVLRGQLTKLAFLVRDEPHNLATLREALEVQEIVEAILEGV